MITVKLYGLFRLDTGIKEIEIPKAGYVKDIYPILLAKAKELNPITKISAQDINGCIVIVNEQQQNKNYILHDGDVVQLISPACGGR